MGKEKGEDVITSLDTGRFKPQEKEMIQRGRREARRGDK